MKKRIKKCIDKIWRSDILLAVAINSIFLISILLFCDIKYEVSDDFVMSAIMSGAYGDKPNPHLIFINILWGYLLQPFYYILPQISWYLIFQLALCFFSLTMISYMMLQKLDRVMAIMVIVLLVTAFGSDAYILVQFTKTAILAVMGGGIVFVWSLFEKRPLKLQLLIGILCLLGTWIRFDVIYIAGGFLLLILVIEFFRLFRSNRNIKKHIIRIICSGGILLVVVVGCKLWDIHAYNKDSDYKFFREYSQARGDIVDASDYGYEAYEEQLRKIDVSENDYLMMRKWNFADNQFFSLERMKKTAQIIADYKRTVELSKEALLEQIQTRGIQGYPICIACIVLTVLGITIQKNKYGIRLSVWIVGFIYIIYFFYIERVVYRIEYAIFLASFCCILYFFEEYKGKSKEDVYVFNYRYGIIILLCLILQCVLYLPDRSYQEIDEQSRKEYIETFFYESWNYNPCNYRKVANKGAKSIGILNEIEQHKDKLYLLDFQTTMQVLYYEWNPFNALPKGAFNNMLYFAGITTNFPECNQILRNYKAEQPLKALVQENVYLVDSDERTLDQKVKYLQEHYYPKARAEIYKEIDGYQIWKLYKE